MKKWIIFVTLIVILLTVLAKVYFDVNVFKVSRVEFKSSKLPEGFEFRVLQISDVHNKAFSDNNEELINTVKELNSDIIVLTGDIIDRKTDDFLNVFTLIGEMTKINSDIYFVSGNHEWGNPYREQFLNGLHERNVTILNNNNTQVTKIEITLNLLGINDFSSGQEDLNRALNNINQELYTILLSHSPDIIEKYNNLPADLILSGHTHGGQVRFPLIGALVAPDQGFFPEYDKGAYKVGPEQYIYIDSGLGTSVVPLRFLNQSQISLIQIASDN